jgi:hypothetical protein
MVDTLITICILYKADFVYPLQNCNLILKKLLRHVPMLYYLHYHVPNSFIGLPNNFILLLVVHCRYKTKTKKS